MRRAAVVAAATVAAGCAVAALWYRRSVLRWNRAESIVRELDETCATPAARLWDVAHAMLGEMRAGLAADGGSNCLRMLVTPIESLPNGDEEGLFYGVELGRTKVRMFCVELGGKIDRVTKKEVAVVPLPINLMVGTSEELYDYIAAELGKFISSQDERSNVQDGKPKEVGVTFSFPVFQTSASYGSLVKWTKGFSIKEKVRGDAVTEINNAMKRQGLGMHVSVLVNDAIGVLAGGRYCNSDTVVAVVVGMGTNASYVESKHAVAKWQGALPGQGEMIINMEWGSFKSFHLPITHFDVHLDMESSNPGEQIFEKLISGMYLGDIVRRVLLKITEETSLFGDSVPPKLRIPYVLRTSDMASMHQDTSEDLVVVGEKLETCLGIFNTTLRMRELVMEVCNIITKRGARLVAAGIVGILKKLEKDGTDKKAVIVVQGGMYEHYRLFRNYLHDGVDVMLQGKFLDNVVVEQLTDGRGIGAALLAAAYSRHARNS